MAKTATQKKSMPSGPFRCGRPPRDRAGEVDARILDAARRVFVRRGFEAASIEEIAEVARAGKPTIYARFPGKEALFTAVVARNVAENARFVEAAPPGESIEERLENIGIVLLRRVLTTDTLGLIRSTIAEARRFPNLASNVGRMARERGSEAVARLLREVARTGELRAFPAFAPKRLATTARFFIDLVVLPVLMRALFGEDLQPLQSEIEAHVARSVAFFLSGCRSRHAD